MGFGTNTSQFSVSHGLSYIIPQVTQEGFSLMSPVVSQESFTA